MRQNASKKSSPVPVIDWSDRWWIRVSCQVYNTPRQYERLADAVLEVLGG